MDVIVTIALGLMVFAALSQVAVGIVYLVFGQDAADKRKGVGRLAMGGALVLLLVLLAGLPACAPISGGEPAAGAVPAGAAVVVDGAALRDAVAPVWLWRGADHPEWASCRLEPASALCTEVRP